MIGVTERAKEELKKILDANTDNAEASLRLMANDQGQLGLVIDMEKQGDQTIEHEDSKVLLVEENLIDALQGVTIDVEDTSEGARLVISTES